MEPTEKQFHAASYARLSREDGDKAESDSIINQQRIIADYCRNDPGIEIVEAYADDGFTGTNFRRPSFQRMIRDIESGRINCVIVKDLSRFGRDYIDMGSYLERFFPRHNVRFIAINDHIDSLLRTYDMMLPLKNVFNTQYARDISEKVRSAFRAKQKRGEFVGAFASYGYLKDPRNRNHLVIDPVASKVVLRIFEMAAAGYGQIRIAKILNEEQIPCPSEYKRLAGENYTNTNRLDKTTYWTYATVHRVLKNEVYRGCTVSNRYYRPTMHGKAKKSSGDDVIIVEGTHEAIIPDDLWRSVQTIVSSNTRTPGLRSHVHIFAGLIRCGDCGRAMCRKTAGGNARYCCGSYAHNGPSVCTKHSVREDDLENLVLKDLNRIVSEVKDLQRLADECRITVDHRTPDLYEKERLEEAVSRIRRLKKKSYEDCCDDLLTRAEYMRYKADYDEQEERLCFRLQLLAAPKETAEEPNDWTERLVKTGRLEALDRTTVTQTIQSILVFDDHRIEIKYLLGEDLRCLFEPSSTGPTIPLHKRDA